MHLQRKKENSISIKADSFCLLFRQPMNWPQFSKFKFTSTLHIFLLSIGLLFMAILMSVSTITDRAHLCSMEPLFMGHSHYYRKCPHKRGIPPLKVTDTKVLRVTMKTFYSVWFYSDNISLYSTF